MKHDTSFIRVVFITMFCLLVFPYFYQTYLHFQSNRLAPAKMEGFEIFAEYDFIKSHISQYIAAENKWPRDLAEARYLNKEKLVKVDLSEPWTLRAIINEKTLFEELEGKTIKFNYSPNMQTWNCDRAVTDLPKQFSPASCAGNLGQLVNNLSSGTWYLMVALAAIIMVFLLAIYRHPLLKLLRSNDFKLSQHNFSDLHKLQYLSWLTGHRAALLKANNITPSIWQKLSRINSKPNIELIKMLQQTLPVESIKSEQKSLLRITLSDQFELNITDVLLLIVKDKTASQVINHINKLADPTTPALIWLADLKENIEIRTQLPRINRACLIPNQSQMTQLLIFDSARPCFIKLAVKHLPINTISPYQGKGGILKSSHFFGRQVILDKLESQFNANFLLVGGRQLGKTSLLKALYRKLKLQESNLCYYISLSDDRLLPRIAYHSGINAYVDFNDMLSQIQQLNPNKKIRLLIDEADLFIKAEVKNQFKLLNQIRQSSEQGLCQFVFAGFWELYANAVLDYHSPLRNIAHSITVGPLESHPAHQLIRQPMSMLEQKFKSDTLVHDIYRQTGGRANLINLVCEYLIGQLTEKKQVIDKQLTEQAYQCDQIQDALQGWSSLTADPKACGMDRLIVYLTFAHGNCSLDLVINALQTHGLEFSPEQLKQSLQRLRLAHIIVKKQQQYHFAVPLFAQQHSSEEAKVLLQQEIQFLRS